MDSYQRMIPACIPLPPRLRWASESGTARTILRRLHFQQPHGDVALPLTTTPAPYW
jgi:hypothetical protein